MVGNNRGGRDWGILGVGMVLSGSLGWTEGTGAACFAKSVPAGVTFFRDRAVACVVAVLLCNENRFV